MFNSETGRKARRRRRGLASWRTRERKGRANVDKQIQSFLAKYSNRITPYKRALQALERGALDHRKKCVCPYHVAAEFSFDIQALRDIVERMTRERDTAVAQLKQALELELTRRALVPPG